MCACLNGERIFKNLKNLENYIWFFFKVSVILRSTPNRSVAPLQWTTRSRHQFVPHGSVSVGCHGAVNVLRCTFNSPCMIRQQSCIRCHSHCNLSRLQNQPHFPAVVHMKFRAWFWIPCDYRNVSRTFVLLHQLSTRWFCSVFLNVIVYVIVSNNRFTVFFNFAVACDRKLKIFCA